MSKLDELRRLSADEDVSRMVAAVMQTLGVLKHENIPEAELDMLIEMAGELHQQLDGGVTTPRPEETPVEVVYQTCEMCDSTKGTVRPTDDDDVWAALCDECAEVLSE